MITITKDKIYISPFTLKKTKVDSEDVVEIMPSEVIYRLSDEVELGEDVTFKDLFDIIVLNEDFFNILFGKEMHGLKIGNFIEDYEKEFEIIFNTSGFNLRLSWNSEIFDYDNEVEYSDYVAFEAFGKLNIKEDKEDYPISIAFVSLSQIRNKHVFLDNSFVIQGESNDESDIDALFKANYRPFSLYDLVLSILREITFFGSPEQREEYRMELEKKAKDFESLEQIEGDDNDFEWNEISEEIDDMIFRDLKVNDDKSFWDVIYPKEESVKPVLNQEKIDSVIIALAEGSDLSLDEQLKKAHNEEDYEKAGKLKRIIDKRDTKK
jgi:hypothetical protein